MRAAMGQFAALILGSCSLLLGSCTAPPAEGKPEPAAEKPASREIGARDVVLVTLDTLRWDALGFMGNGESVTPNLDRLASEGRVFERAWANQSQIHYGNSRC